MAGEEAKQAATLMVRLMNNIDIALIGAVAGFAVAKLTGRKNRGMGGF
ncbi:MAG: hypothetical protein ABEK16_03735 [Candidatus Nanohalobium sp.]